jgi:hypothetical protein
LSLSSSSSNISSQFSGQMSRKSPGLYYRQLGGSIIVLRLSLPYQGKCSPVCLTFPELVVCESERPSQSPKTPGLSYLQWFIWPLVWLNI